MAKELIEVGARRLSVGSSRRQRRPYDGIERPASEPIHDRSFDGGRGEANFRCIILSTQAPDPSGPHLGCNLLTDSELSDGFIETLDREFDPMRPNDSRRPIDHEGDTTVESNARELDRQPRSIIKKYTSAGKCPRVPDERSPR
jgi:hypothetical protein